VNREYRPASISGSRRVRVSVTNPGCGRGGGEVALPLSLLTSDLTTPRSYGRRCNIRRPHECRGRGSWPLDSGLEEAGVGTFSVSHSLLCFLLWVFYFFFFVFFFLFSREFILSLVCAFVPPSARRVPLAKACREGATRAANRRPPPWARSRRGVFVHDEPSFEMARYRGSASHHGLRGFARAGAQSPSSSCLNMSDRRAFPTHRPAKMRSGPPAKSTRRARLLEWPPPQRPARRACRLLTCGGTRATLPAASIIEGGDALVPHVCACRTSTSAPTRRSEKHLGDRIVAVGHTGS